MLIDLKITTIGKIISSVLVISFVAVGLQIFNLPTTNALGESAALSFTSTNGVDGGNVVSLNIDTDGFEASVLVIRYKAVGFTELDYTLDSGFPLNSKQESTDTDGTILTLFHTTNKLMGTDTVLTFVADPNGAMTADGSIEILAGTYMVQGGIRVDLPTVTYTVSNNVAPTITIDNLSDGDTEVPYNTGLDITVTDMTDSSVTSVNTALKESDGAGGWNSLNIDNYFDFPNSIPAGQTIGSSTSIINKQYLDYNTLYQLTIGIVDDQSSEVSSIIEFTTQIDNVAPKPSLQAFVTKSEWSSIATDIVTEFEFVPTEDVAPGKLQNFFLFDKNQASSITNGYDGLSYDDPVLYKTQLEQIVTSGTYYYSEAFTYPLDSKYSVGIAAGSYNGVVPALKKLNFQTSVLTLVTRDEGGNFSDPIQVMKIGDVRSDTGGFPNGVVNLGDARYIYKHLLDPIVCPLPPMETINTFCN